MPTAPLMVVGEVAWNSPRPPNSCGASDSPINPFRLFPPCSSYPVHGGWEGGRRRSAWGKI